MAVLEAVGKTCFEEEGVFSLLIKCCRWVTVVGGKAERGRRTDPVVRVLVFRLLLSSQWSENHRLEIKGRDEALEV